MSEGKGCNVNSQHAVERYFQAHNVYFLQNKENFIPSVRSKYFSTIYNASPTCEAGLFVRNNRIGSRLWQRRHRRTAHKFAETVACREQEQSLSELQTFLMWGHLMKVVVEIEISFKWEARTETSEFDLVRERKFDCTVLNSCLTRKGEKLQKSFCQQQMNAQMIVFDKMRRLMLHGITTNMSGSTDILQKSSRGTCNRPLVKIFSWRPEMAASHELFSRALVISWNTSFSHSENTRELTAPKN